MNLKQIHDLARWFKSYREFKSQVDKYFNGTPETVVDDTEYKLVKNNVYDATNTFVCNDCGYNKRAIDTGKGVFRCSKCRTIQN